MKLKLFLFGAVLLVAAFIANIAAQNPGYVFLSIGDFSAKVPFASLVILMLLAVVGVYLVIRVIRIIWTPGRWLGKQLLGGSRERATIRSQDGVQAFLGGDYKRAAQLLMAASGNIDKPILNYLLAALSSQAIGNEERARELVEQALEECSKSELQAVLLVKSEVLQAQQHWEQSLAVLEELDERNEKVLIAKIEAFTALKDWISILALEKPVTAASILSVEDRSEIIGHAVRSQIHRIKYQVERGRAAEEDLDTFWRTLSKNLRKDEELVATLARVYIDLSAGDKAERILNPWVIKGVSDRIVSLYGMAVGLSPVKQLKRMQGALGTTRLNDIQLHAHARLSMRCELWGQAKDDYMKLCDGKANLAAYQECSLLLDAMGEHSAARAIRRRGMQAAASAIELPLPKH